MRFLVALLALSSLSSVAYAHGNLPLSQQIFVQGSTLLVPTRGWGIFRREANGDLRWICEEAINKNPNRLWAVAGDGSYHVTDYSGVTSSRDGGCTFVPATGDLAARPTSMVTADPIDPHGVWATTYAGTDLPWNALFYSGDAGVTWTPVVQLDAYLFGVAVSPDGQTLYVVGVERVAMGRAVVQVSRDRGKTFTAVPLDYTIDGARPSQLRTLAVDPASPSTVYLAAYADPWRTVVKLDGYGATATEVYRTGNDVGGIAFDAARDARWIATSGGLVRSMSGGAFERATNLSSTQCIVPDGDNLFACASNFPPDSAAVARSTDGVHFGKVFQYAEATGVITSCAANSPVATICPPIWETIGSQLGAITPVDGGADGGSAAMPHGKGCAIGGPGVGGSAILWLALVALARRRRKDS